MQSVNYFRYILKNGSKMDPKNYRPISLLPLMSKALEGTVHEKTMEFRDKHNILLEGEGGSYGFESYK